MRTTTCAVPLTVWVGTTMYTFAPGRDIIVGRDIRSDICLDGPDSTWVSREHFVLRFDGGHWAVIDRSRNGTYLDGVRVSAAIIRSGQHITAGDPQRGPRLVFQVGVPPGAAVPGAWVGPALPSSAAPGRQPEPPPVPPNPPPTQAPTLPGFPAIRLQRPQPESCEPPPADPAPAVDAPMVNPTGELAERDAATVEPPAEPGSDESTEHLRQLAPTPAKSPESDHNPARRLIGRLRTWLRDPHTPARPKPANQQDAERPADVDEPERTLGWEIRDKGSGSDTTLVRRPTAAGGDVTADGLGLVVDGHQLLTDVCFTARPGTLTAVIGPPGAGKSSLIALLSGAARPTSGLVTCDGHNLHADDPSMRSRIAVVPHHDVMHHQLAVEQILGYAAELRLPPDTSAAERRAAVNRVIDEANLGAQRAVKAGNLSAGERKRVSVAIELLTGPSLVVFEEPSGKPDRGLDRQVMTTARRLADAGRVVVVATHSLAALNLCDQVLLLASGEVAFAGPPADIEQAVSKARWSHAFPPGGADGGGDAAPTDQQGDTPEQPPETPGEAPERGSRTSLWRQTSMLIRRQVRLIAADRGYLVAMAVLPVVFGALSLSVPHRDDPYEVGQLLVVLNSGAVVMGVAGLTLSALAEHRRELPALFLLASLVAVVFAGGMFPLAHRVGLNQLSWLVPSRWGFAASASTMDLGAIGLPGTPHELWTHSPSWWLSAMGILLVFGALWTGALSWRLRMVSRG